MSSADTAREAALVPITWTVEIGDGETARRIELTAHVRDSPLTTDEHLADKARTKLVDEEPDGRFCTYKVER